MPPNAPAFFVFTEKRNVCSYSIALTKQSFASSSFRSPAVRSALRGTVPTITTAAVASVLLVACRLWGRCSNLKNLSIGSSAISSSVIMGCGGRYRTVRPPNYESGDLPLIYPAIERSFEELHFYFSNLRRACDLHHASYSRLFRPVSHSKPVWRGRLQRPSNLPHRAVSPAVTFCSHNSGNVPALYTDC